MISPGNQTESKDLPTMARPTTPNVFAQAEKAAKPDGRKPAVPPTIWKLEEESPLNATLRTYLEGASEKRAADLKADGAKLPLSDECHSRWLDHLAEHGARPGSSMKLATADGTAAVTFIVKDDPKRVGDEALARLAEVLGDEAMAAALVTEMVLVMFDPNILAQPVAKAYRDGTCPTVYDWIGGRLSSLLAAARRDGWLSDEQAAGLIMAEKKRVTIPGFSGCIAGLSKGDRGKAQAALDAMGGLTRYVQA